MTYLKTKLDANQKGIVADLRKQGVEVVEIMQPLDLLARFRYDAPAFLEIKVAGSRARYTRKQLQFISQTKFDVAIVKDSTEAIHVLRSCEYITRHQKNCLASFLVMNVKQLYWPSEIEKVLA